MLKHRALTLCAAIALSLGAGATVAAITAGPAAAQDEERRKPQTRKVETLDKKTFDRLTEAQLKLAPEDPGVRPDYRGAARILDELLAGDLNSYGQALVWQTYGYIYAEQEDYPAAIRAFERALATEGLPEGNDLSLKYNVAQLYMATEQYAKSVQTLKSWFADPNNTKPPANAYILLGNGYAQLEQYREAITPIKTAIDRAIQEQRDARAALANFSGTAEERQAAQDRADSARGPQESWYQLLLAMHLELQEYRPAKELLEFLVTTYPKSRQVKTYWSQLGAINSELGDEKKAFAILEFQYHMDLFERSEEFERFAQLYLYHGVPHIAAELMDKHIQGGEIEREVENYELLANAYFNAREYAKAIEPLSAAARRSSDGDLSFRLGQALYETGRFQDAEQALVQAVEKGNLDNSCRVNLMLGITRDELGKTDAAIRAFSNAARSNDSRCKGDAESWIKFLDQTKRAREGT